MERQMFEGGVYLQLGFSVHAYLLTEKDVHKILQMKKTQLVTRQCLSSHLKINTCMGKYIWKRKQQRYNPYAIGEQVSQLKEVS